MNKLHCIDEYIFLPSPKHHIQCIYFLGNLTLISLFYSHGVKCSLWWVFENVWFWTPVSCQSTDHIYNNSYYNNTTNDDNNNNSISAWIWRFNAGNGRKPQHKPVNHCHKQTHKHLRNPDDLIGISYFLSGRKLLLMDWPDSAPPSPPPTYWNPIQLHQTLFILLFSHSNTADIIHF